MLLTVPPTPTCPRPGPARSRADAAAGDALRALNNLGCAPCRLGGARPIKPANRPFHAWRGPSVPDVGAFGNLTQPPPARKAVVGTDRGRLLALQPPQPRGGTDHRLRPPGQTPSTTTRRSPPGGSSVGL